MSRINARAPSEFWFSVFSLVIAVILVHGAYVTVVRPRAEAVLAEQRAAMKKDPDFVAQRSIYVVLKDWEQEAEIILGLWALAIIGYKTMHARRERALLARDLVHVPEGMRILPEDTRDYARPIEALPPAEGECLLPRALLVALYRFGATRNVQDVSDAARGVCSAEADRLDAELSNLRYIAWAIPAIGFIGTVRGIGDALGRHRGPRHGLQLDAGRALDQHRADVPAAPAAARPGAAGARRRDLPGPQPDQAHAAALSR